MGLRRTVDEKAALIDDLRIKLATQQDQIDQLTRTVAVLRLVAKSVLKRPGVETR